MTALSGSGEAIANLTARLDRIEQRQQADGELLRAIAAHLGITPEPDADD